MFRPANQSVRALASVALCILTLCLASPRAAAQGTQGTLPDPISTNELSEYAKRLKLSDQQRLAAQDMHDEYKTDFRALRDGEIAGFLKDMRELGGEGGSRMPSRKKIEGFLKQMNLLHGKISTLDSRFFDHLQTILTPDQQATLPRVRQARQRTRYASANIMMMTGYPLVDLSDIALAMELPPDQLLITDPILSSYENKLTSGMAKLYETSTSMLVSMFDLLEQQGITDESDFSDPEVQKKANEAMQTSWATLASKS